MHVFHNAGVSLGKTRLDFLRGITKTAAKKDPGSAVGLQADRLKSRSRLNIPSAFRPDKPPPSPADRIIQSLRHEIDQRTAVAENTTNATRLEDLLPSLRSSGFSGGRLVDMLESYLANKRRTGAFSGSVLLG